MKKTFVALFVLSSLVISSAAFAADVDIFLSDSEISLFTGTSKTVDMIVRNNQPTSDVFSISMFPPMIGKVSVFPSPERITIESGANGTSKLSFNAFLDALESQTFFNITAKSISNQSVIASRLIQVTVKRTIPVFISAISVNKDSFKPGESATISTTVTNGGGLISDKYVLQTTLKRGNDVVKVFTDSVPRIDETSSKQMNNTYTFGLYETPGDYSIVSVLKNLDGKDVSSSTDIKLLTIKLAEVPSTVISEKSTQIGILNINTTIKVKNEGNVPAEGFYVTETVPILAKDIFEPKFAPNVTESKGTDIIYGWYVESLAPGQEFTVIYQFNLWKIWTAAILIGAAIFIAFKYVFTVAVSKRISHVDRFAKGKDVVVHIEVKNRSLNEVKDVIVRDGVPSFAEVVERFFTLKPTVKKTTTGTALIWKFDSLKPNEERVLTYTFKPRIDVVGSVRLPLASAMYNTPRHQTKTAYSNRIIVGKNR